MILTAKPPNKENILYYLHEYQPKKGGTNPKFDAISQQILDFKAGVPKAMTFFYNEVEPLLGTDFTIVVPPSSAAGTNVNYRPLCVLARRLAGVAGKNRVDGTGCLVRKTSVIKHTRDIDQHLNTIELEHQELISGKDILLLDDVATSLSTLKACYLKLKEAKPNSIQPLTLGRTV